MVIKIDFTSNTRSVTRDVEKIGDAFDKVSDSLDDVARDARRSGDAVSDATRDSARDAERSGDKIGDAYKDAGKEGERSAERLERAFKEASDATATSSKRGADDLARNTQQGTSRAKADLEELGNEARQNAAETFSSFDGSAESFADGLQGTLGGIVSSLGPVGAAFGALGAIGLGTLMTQLAEGKERSEALEQATADLTAEYLETGRIGSTSISYLVDQLKELATAHADGETSLADLNAVADKSGSSYEDLARAMSGNVDGIDDLLDRQRQLLEASKEQLTADQEGLGYRDKAYSSDQIEGIEKYISYLEQARDTTASAAEQTKLFNEAGGPALEAAAQATEDYASSVQDAYADAGAGVEDYVGGSVEALQKYTEEAAAQADAVAAYQQNMTALAGVLSAEALNYVASLGPAAAPLIADFVKAPLAQQQATADVWARLGSTSSSAFASKVENDLGGRNFNANVNLRANPQQIIDALASRRYDIAVNARVQNNIASQLPAGQGMGVP